MPGAPKLGIIVPCYNEAEIIVHSSDQLVSLLNRLISANVVSPESFVGLVDDHSKDNTWELIKSLTKKEPRIKAIRLASNRGHQYALLAGLLEFNLQADCLISLDADLQDDINVIEVMIGKFLQGNEIVYGVRQKRPTDGFVKKVTADLFYRFLKSMKANVIYNHADFRLTGRRVVEELRNFTEINLYLRGIFPLMGFDSAMVYYDRKERMGGVSKYPLKKMVSLALDGITSFSIVPLRLITLTGFIVFFSCLLLMAYALVGYFSHKTVAGWFSTVLPFYFLGGIQILCIGIIGEYLGKIYKEVKRRPRYIIDDRI
jgi:glycosyltransferase involved in cell wall biosynthesis